MHGYNRVAIFISLYRGSGYDDIAIVTIYRDYLILRKYWMTQFSPHRPGKVNHLCKSITIDRFFKDAKVDLTSTEMKIYRQRHIYNLILFISPCLFTVRLEMLLQWMIAVHCIEQKFFQGRFLTAPPCISVQNLNCLIYTKNRSFWSRRFRQFFFLKWWKE